MIRYLLDRDVMSQLDQPEAKRHPNVRAWFASVPDNLLYISAITVVEAWRGLTAVRNSAGPTRRRNQDRYEAAFELLLSSLSDRIVPIDEHVAKAWGLLLGQKDKNRFDTCLAATAAVHDMVVATRNTFDFQQRGVRVLDPFVRHPKIASP